MQSRSLTSANFPRSISFITEGSELSYFSLRAERLIFNTNKLNGKLVENSEVFGNWEIRALFCHERIKCPTARNQSSIDLNLVLGICKFTASETEPLNMLNALAPERNLLSMNSCASQLAVAKFIQRV